MRPMGGSMKRLSAGVWCTALLAGAWLSDAPPALSQSPATTCETSTVVPFVGNALDANATIRNGVVYDTSSGTGTLRLARLGGDYQTTGLGLSQLPIFAAAGDFDGTGGDDFVGADATGVMAIFQNASPSGFTPITPPTPFPSFAPGQDHMLLAAGDFDGDGAVDIFRADSALGSAPSEASIWRNTGGLTFDGPHGARILGSDGSTADASLLGTTTSAGNNIAVADYNGDRRLDLLVGSGDGSGSVRLFLNTCTLQDPQPTPAPSAPAPLACQESVPTFRYAGTLIDDLGMSSTPVLTFADFDGDSIGDLVVGGPGCCSEPELSLRLFRGVAGGGFHQPQTISFSGGAVALHAADTSRDGLPDLVVATDDSYSATSGGQLIVYRNNGTLQPFRGPQPAPITANGSPLTDNDIGVVLDYDNDGTADIFVGDGVSTSSYLMIANRASTSEYVNCGEVISSPIDTSTISDVQMVITAARLQPDVTINGGTLQIYMSAEEQPDWVLANDCADGTGSYCVRFPKPAGKSLRWKARLCADATRTATPNLNGIAVKFDYIPAFEHYRGSMIVDDGVAYLGGFSQPGDRGRLYAARADLDLVDSGTGQRYYWEFSERLQADSGRKIFTFSPNDGSQIELTTTAASDLLDALNVGSAAQAQQVVSWVRQNPRFGAGTAVDGLAKTHIGAIETSTPAVLGKPRVPIWYSRASVDDRNQADAFIAAYQNRQPLILVGAKDGMVHAIRNNPTAIADAQNGTEAWAFVPPDVARRLAADHAASLIDTDGLSISAYPDGSPTLIDVKIGGSLETLALIGGGKGGKGITAIRVTESVDFSQTPPAANGPHELLWHRTPGGADAGQGFSKPVIARVNISGQERFIAIAGTGIAYEDTLPSNDEVTPSLGEEGIPNLRGRTVAAYDVVTGESLWKFRTVCPLTSEITVFETDDELEPNAPKLDGFVDRAVFADRCGYLYKVDPAKDLDGDWNVNTGLGAIQAAVVDGQQLFALFSTKDSADALGQQRAIAGNLAARADETTRMTLFFGTGGLEQADPTLRNAFYAVYADTGEIRDSGGELAGACTSTTPRQCEKFYGGVIVNAEQVIFSRTLDPIIGAATCDPGSTVIEGRGLDDFISDFSVGWTGLMMSPISSHGGAVYFTTGLGEAARIGTPRASEAGGDSAGGVTDPVSGGEDSTTGTKEPLLLLGWRQVY